MLSATRVSRWIMYVGLLAFAGTLMAGQLLSAAVSLLLVVQHVAIVAYQGYNNGESADTAVRDETV